MEYGPGDFWQLSCWSQLEVVDEIDVFDTFRIVRLRDSQIVIEWRRTSLGTDFDEAEPPELKLEVGLSLFEGFKISRLGLEKLPAENFLVRDVIKSFATKKQKFIYPIT